MTVEATERQSTHVNIRRIHPAKKIKKKLFKEFRLDSNDRGFICAGVNFVGGYKWHALFYLSCLEQTYYCLSTNEKQTYYCLSTNEKLLVSLQFSGTYGVTKYGSGWRKECRKPVLGVCPWPCSQSHSAGSARRVMSVWRQWGVTSRTERSTYVQPKIVQLSPVAIQYNTIQYNFIVSM